MTKKIYRLLNKKSTKSKSVDSTTIHKVDPKVGGNELKRRDFMKLSALAAGAALATVVLEGSLKPLSLIPKTTNQLLFAPRKDNLQMNLVESLTISNINGLNPLSIPKFENQ
jgi:hypothetical protein